MHIRCLFVPVGLGLALGLVITSAAAAFAEGGSFSRIPTSPPPAAAPVPGPPEVPEDEFDPTLASGSESEALEPASGAPAPPEEGADAASATAAEEEPARPLHHTPACVFDQHGGVIFAPKGRDCGVTERPPARERTEAELRGLRRNATPPAAPAPARGRCILGSRGEVIFAPPGVDCRR